MAKPHEDTCPLCGGAGTSPFYRDKHRDYLSCRVCGLVFVPPAQHLAAANEKAFYDRHDNRPDDPRYRDFLDRLFAPLNQRLAARSRGLDFGSGPGPTLSVMFEEAGHQVALHDPFFKPNPNALKTTYDFITATEVLEHLHHPRRDLEAVWNCLQPGGWLGLTTKRARDREAFAQWHYKQDPTHVCFWSGTSLQWLANHWNACLELIEPDVALLQK